MMSMTKRTSRALLGGLLAVIGLWLAPLPVLADTTAPSPISSETRVSQRQVTIGDIVTYSIVVRHDAVFMSFRRTLRPILKKGLTM